MASAAGSVKRTKRERAEDIASELATRISAVTVASTHAEAGSDASTMVIGTHSGTFHCDEALACGLLLMLPAYADAGTVLHLPACMGRGTLLQVCRSAHTQSHPHTQ